VSRLFSPLRTADSCPPLAKHMLTARGWWFLVVVVLAVVLGAMALRKRDLRVGVLSVVAWLVLGAGIVRAWVGGVPRVEPVEPAERGEPRRGEGR